MVDQYEKLIDINIYGHLLKSINIFYYHFSRFVSYLYSNNIIFNIFLFLINLPQLKLYYNYC